MATTDTTLQAAILKKIAWSAEREKTLGRNIANAETPGFQRSDLKQLEFKDLVNKRSTMSDLATTSPRHLTASTSNPFKPEVERNQLLSNTDTGVNIEEEMTQVSLNYGKAQFARNLYKKYRLF